MNALTVGVVGNPNCGKTTLFNALTGARQQVGNWPGVTVDRKVGFYTYEDDAHGEVKVELVDTPGIYSLSAASLDEEVARNFILSREAALIINIVDASNIERNLYLTTQLLEMRAPLLVALNMMDMAEAGRLEIDVEGLSERLGCPVIPMSASQGDGVEELRRAIAACVSAAVDCAAEGGTRTQAEASYPVAVQEARQELVRELSGRQDLSRMPLDWVALKLLEGEDAPVPTFVAGGALAHLVERKRQDIEEREGEECDIVIASARYGFVSRLTEGLVRRRGEAGASLSERIDRVVLSRLWGIPIFLAAMYATFMITINVGNVFIDFFDQFFATLFVDGLKQALAFLRLPEWLQVLLADGVGGGLQTMATFIPPIGFMFLCLAFLEDSGYMARAAFVMDRFMRFVGLPGKAFVPMLVGFGCNVPAIMATRTLESERDRIMTITMNPFMSCGARLPVYALFAAAFFPAGGQNLVFLLYLTGIAFAVFTGLVMKHTLLRGEATPFVMELPPYHLPSWRTVALRAYDRLQAFLFRAAKVIIPIIVVLSFFNSMGTDGSFGHEDSNESVLSAAGKRIAPVLRPLGVTDENWPAAVGVFTGIFAKEAVVGTLNSLYAGLADSGAQAAGTGGAAEEEPFDFLAGLAGAFATIPENILGLTGTLLDPLGISVGSIADSSAAAEEQGVDAGVFGSMQALFGGKIAAFSYLLFILLYAPCVAALSAVYRETNLNWALFVAFWTTLLAFAASSTFYQVATFAGHPGYSITVLLSVWGVLTCVLFLLRLQGLRMQEREKPAEAVYSTVS